MISNIPVTRENTDEALRVLAVIKAAKDELSKREKVVKAYLEVALRPGDRCEALTGDNESLATVSMNKGRKTGGLVIVDPMALADWCDEHGEDHGAKPSVVFPEWFVKNGLSAIVEKLGGELPDGVEDTTDIGAPSLSVRQTPAQKDALFAAVAAVRPMLEAAEMEVAG